MKVGSLPVSTMVRTGAGQESIYSIPNCNRINIYGGPRSTHARLKVAVGIKTDTLESHRCSWTGRPFSQEHEMSTVCGLNSPAGHVIVRGKLKVQSFEMCELYSFSCRVHVSLTQNCQAKLTV